jgi:hypothetical protein
LSEDLNLTKLVVGLAALMLLCLTAYPLGVSAQITAPSPFFEFSPLSPRVGDTVTFDASKFMEYWTESAIVSLVWDFGDGTTAAGAVVNHCFTRPGEYWVGLTAADDRGMSPMTQLLVTVTEQTPVTVYVSLSDERIYIGQELTISGNLTYEGRGVPDAEIYFSTKNFSDNAQWVNIGSAKTNSDGLYTFIWSTQTPNGYQIRALWAGNSTYPQTSLSRMLYVNSFGDLVTGFSSNSTVTDLIFNMTTRMLSFTAEGPSGTSGYVNVTLKKDPSFNPQNLTVLFDGQPIPYTTESTEAAWTLHFTYTHSVHNILVDFTGASAGSSTPNASPSADVNQPQPFPAAAIAAVLAAATVVFVGFAVYFKKYRK